MNKGRIHQIIGPVIDIKFREDEMPELLNAVDIDYDGRRIVTEVAQHIGDDVARCVALSSTDGLRRGMEAVDTGAPIQVPVGNEVLGRMFNVIGETIDEKGDVATELKEAIHRAAPPFEEQDTSAQIFETGIKVIDLIAPVELSFSCSSIKPMRSLRSEALVSGRMWSDMTIRS